MTVLHGPNVTLRPPVPEDAAAWARWLNDPEVAVPLAGEVLEPVPVLRCAQEIDDVVRTGVPVFTVEVAGRAVGRCLLNDVDPVNGTASVGLLVGERSLWGRGIGGEALDLLLQVAFDVHRLDSVMLGVYAFNERALRCYRRAGFREIGRRRRARLVAGTRYDGVLMDLLAEEYRARPGATAAIDLVDAVV